MRQRPFAYGGAFMYVSIYSAFCLRMFFTSPCFESLELFWKTVETLGAEVLAERHRSPGTSPWRLHSVSSAPSRPSHDPCFMSAMRWRAHSAVQWTEHLELRAKTENSSQVSSRYSVTGREKQYSANQVCALKVFSPNVCSALEAPPKGPRNTAGGDAHTPSQENRHGSTV